MGCFVCALVLVGATFAAVGTVYLKSKSKKYSEKPKKQQGGLRQ